jgi:hypothetical protein
LGENDRDEQRKLIKYNHLVAYRLDLNRQPGPIDYQLPILGF